MWQLFQRSIAPWRPLLRKKINCRTVPIILMPQITCFAFWDTTEIPSGPGPCWVLSVAPYTRGQCCCCFWVSAEVALFCPHVAKSIQIQFQSKLIFAWPVREPWLACNPTPGGVCLSSVVTALVCSCLATCTLKKVFPKTASFWMFFNREGWRGLSPQLE